MAAAVTQTRSRWKLARLLRPYWIAATLAPLSMVVEVAMDLVQPCLLQRIVDVGIAQLDMAVVLNTGLLMIGLPLVGALGGIGSTIFAVQASVGFGTDVRSVLFRKVQQLSFGNLDRLGTGPLVTRLDRLNTLIQENLAGVRLVEAFVRADYEQERFRAGNDSLMEQTISAPRLVAVVMPAMMLTVNLGISGVVWFGGVQVSRGELQVGQSLAFVNYLLSTLFSLMMLGMLLMRVFRAMASADRIQDVLDSEPVIGEPAMSSMYLSSSKRHIWLQRELEG